MKKNLFRRIGSLALALLMVLALFTGCTAQEVVDVGFAIVDGVLSEGDADVGIIGGADGPTAVIVGDTEDTFVKSGDEEVEPTPEESHDAPAPETIAEDGWYDTPGDVAEYIHTYGHLPENFITKSEAEDLGWVSSEGNLWDVAYGMSIGGDRFGNREGLLPDAEGRKWYECDVNYAGGYRGSERIVFSNDGLVYYTADHYESFEQLY